MLRRSSPKAVCEFGFKLTRPAKPEALIVRLKGVAALDAGYDYVPRVGHGDALKDFIEVKPPRFKRGTGEGNQIGSGQSGHLGLRGVRLTYTGHPKIGQRKRTPPPGATTPNKKVSGGQCEMEACASLWVEAASFNRYHSPPTGILPTNCLKKRDAPPAPP